MQAQGEGDLWNRRAAPRLVVLWSGSFFLWANTARVTEMFERNENGVLLLLPLSSQEWRVPVLAASTLAQTA